MVNHALVTILKHWLSVRSDHSWLSLVPLVETWSARAISRIMFATTQVRSFSWLVTPITVTITIARRIKLRSSHSFLLHFPWNFRRQKFTRTYFTFLWYFHGLLWISPSSTVTLYWATGLRRLLDVWYFWWYIEARLRDRLLLITLLSSICLNRIMLSSIGLISYRHVGGMMVITRWFAIVKIKVSLWIIAATATTNYLRRISRSIDYSRMCVFNLSWHWIHSRFNFTTSPFIHSAISRIKTERISSRWFVDVFYILHCILISHCERWLFYCFILSSSLSFEIFLFSSFVLLEMGIKLFTIDWLIANDAINSIKRPFHVEWKWTIRISIVGWSSFRIRRIMPDLWVLFRVGSMSWCVNILIFPDILLRGVHSNRWITTKHSWRWLSIGMRRWLMNGLMIWCIYNRHFWLPGKRMYGLYILWYT